VSELSGAGSYLYEASRGRTVALLLILPDPRQFMASSSSSWKVEMSHDAALLPMKIVTHITSLSRATIYRRVAAGTFPKPISLGGRRVAFAREDLDRWIANPMNYLHAEGGEA
jgi:prophage regulatory protein